MPNSSDPTRAVSPGFYGPVTATLDWCEVGVVYSHTMIIWSKHHSQANYQFSYYVAEMANTFSNVFSISLAILGAVQAARQSLPTRYIFGYTVFVASPPREFLRDHLVGNRTGWHWKLCLSCNFTFSSTISWWVAHDIRRFHESMDVIRRSAGIWLAFITYKSSHRSLRPVWSSLLIDIVSHSTVSQADDVAKLPSFYNRNPIYHQIVFATIVFAVTFRVTYLLKWSKLSFRIPDKKRSTIGKLFSRGATMFALGFFIWNLDNIFCDTLTHWKVSVGWPCAFLLEGMLVKFLLLLLSFIDRTSFSRTFLVACINRKHLIGSWSVGVDNV
jgi:dihydroceramidase